VKIYPLYDLIMCVLYDNECSLELGEGDLRISDRVRNLIESIHEMKIS